LGLHHGYRVGIKVSEVRILFFDRLFSAEWMQARRAALLFLGASLLTIALTPIFPLGIVSQTDIPEGWKIGVNLLGALSVVSLFGIWYGMWCYWERLDTSDTTSRRRWRLVLLFGVWYGSCLYCWFVYAPKILRKPKQLSSAAESNL
jgi:hypothetical protein